MAILSPRRPKERENRRGAITVLAALLSIVLLAITALSVDVGYILSVKEEMQRTADAAALAAAWEYGKGLSEGKDAYDCELQGRAGAAALAVENVVATVGPEVAPNYANNANGDLVFGYVNDFYASNVTLDPTASNHNAVRVKVRRDSTLNGQAPLFFARIFGRTGQSLEANATAAIIRDVWGFKTPAGGGTIDLLPFALDLETWEDWMAGCVPDDDWTWDSDSQQIISGGDGLREVNLYPQGTGSPGNRGTVDIGSSNNSTNDIVRQILYGVNANDLSYHGDELKFNECGKLYLNGDTGISAGVKDELKFIKGQPRIIPIFSEVNGPGNNAIFTIVKWQGIRIVDVKLTGPMNKKHVTIQVAPVVAPGVIPSSETGSSGYVYSPAILIN